METVILDEPTMHIAENNVGILIFQKRYVGYEAKCVTFTGKLKMKSKVRVETQRELYKRILEVIAEKHIKPINIETVFVPTKVVDTIRWNEEIRVWYHTS